MSRQPCNISVQLGLWQERTGYDDEKAARELGVPVSALQRWKRGEPCGLASMIETKIGMPVQRRGRLIETAN